MSPEDISLDYVVIHVFPLFLSQLEIPDLGETECFTLKQQLIQKIANWY